MEDAHPGRKFADINADKEITEADAAEHQRKKMAFIHRYYPKASDDDVFEAFRGTCQQIMDASIAAFMSEAQALRALGRRHEAAALEEDMRRLKQRRKLADEEYKKARHKEQLGLKVVQGEKKPS